jgi:long-chain acyl-CoA synthetase
MSPIPERFISLIDFISLNAEWYPEKTFIIFENRKLTWGAFHQRLSRVANHLNRIGISRGDNVAILSQNCLEYPEIMFGALKAGAVIVPISTMLRKETVRLQVNNAEPKAIFAAGSHLHLVENSGGRRIVLGGREDGWIEYEDFLQEEFKSDPPEPPGPEDPYNIIYSSGTTGIPKGIVHTHQARVLFAMTCGLEFRVHNEAISLISTPLYANGTQLIYLPTILTGGTLVLMRSFDPLEFLRIVQQQRCTHAFLVPTQFIRIMEHPKFGDFDTSSMEILLSAAAPLRKQTKSQILERFPRSKLVELYGITEGISTVLRPDEQFSKLGSVGKPRLGGQIKIIDSQGKELPRGEAGEIAGFNFSMMAGYYRNPEMSREAEWHDQAGRRYIRTGDIGRLDEDGYLYILDRKKDMIISGGINIFPSDIEEVLSMHPEVAESAVIGVPHREWGETPLALVVKRNPASRLDATELRDWANDRLAAYQKLSAVEFRDSFPRNDLEKVLKRELRKPYWQ